MATSRSPHHAPPTTHHPPPTTHHPPPATRHPPPTTHYPPPTTQIAAGTYTPPEAPLSKKRNVQSFAEHSHTLLIELLTTKAEPAAQAAVFDVRNLTEIELKWL